jgi:16S rRNA (guanine527-N7)-methyltransferase
VPDAESRAALVAGLREHGVGSELADRLADFGALLLEANRRVNLTGAKDAAALLPHLRDALTLVPFVRPGASLVDVGSGGGLPGIPLAIATGVRVTLVEPIAKKAAFLREALAALDLAGEAAAVSRAPTVAELTLPFLRIGGRALLQRGSLDERERRAVEDAAPVLGGAVIDEVRLEGEQRVLVLEKQRPSSERFPRRNGVPEKRPLCWDEPPAERERSP